MGFMMPAQMNPAEFYLDLTNIDFAHDYDAAVLRLETIQCAWAKSVEAAAIGAAFHDIQNVSEKRSLIVDQLSMGSKLLIPITLLHRAFIKSYRDIVVYGIRILMYTGKHIEKNSPLS